MKAQTMEGTGLDMYALLEDGRACASFSTTLWHGSAKHRNALKPACPSRLKRGDSLSHSTVDPPLAFANLASLTHEISR